jgi:hypothetical protein
VARDDTPRPSEFVYISERKLLALARARGISTAWFERHLTLEGSGRLSLPLPPGSGLSAQATAGVERVQPDQHEQAIERLLDRVVRELDREGVTDLDAGTGVFTESSWFRFHRRLRFGVASGEYDPDLRALVLVDREAVEDYSLVPGLLMFGSPEHLLAPYRTGQLDRSPGARTSSSTGTLFSWLQRTRKSLEADPRQITTSCGTGSRWNHPTRRTPCTTFSHVMTGWARQAFHGSSTAAPAKGSPKSR